jgi:3-phenylpropionate/cinnamic acid dioxygenase small subunit
MSARNLPTAADLADFVYGEARLLDERRFQEWYDLFAEDGRYWLPMRRDQTDAVGEQSITVEDKPLLLKARVLRLTSGKTYSDKPPVLCQHVLQAPVCEELDHAANRYRTRAPFLYAEFRGEEQRLFAGTAQHLLRLDGGTLRIVEKRVDLLNAAAPLGTLFLMP